MKTISLKNGIVVFVEQIAFIHVQPSVSNGVKKSEIHVHFSATFSLDKGSRSMRTVIGEDCAQDFIDQLEKHGVDCTHIRRCIADISKSSMPIGQHDATQNLDTPDDITKSRFDALLAATATDNFEEFISVGDERFKSGLKPEAFHRVSRGLAPRMQKGFASTFFGELRQNSSMVSLWRLRFDDKGDDLLFRMSIADGKVTGALVAPAFNY
jgi:hypothetical protein